MNNPFEDMPPLFDPSNLTRYIEEACQLIDDMKNLDKPPPREKSNPYYKDSNVIKNQDYKLIHEN